MSQAGLSEHLADFAASGHGGLPVNIVNMTDEEILAIADPLWSDLVRHSNEGKYGEFVKNFSGSLALAMNQVRRAPVRKQRTGQKPVR